jgi:hypothetical protein
LVKKFNFFVSLNYFVLIKLDCGLNLIVFDLKMMRKSSASMMRKLLPQRCKNFSLKDAKISASEMQNIEAELKDAKFLNL